jgi:hypothetical protein
MACHDQIAHLFSDGVFAYRPTLGTSLERKHQRTAAPVLPQTNRPVGARRQDLEAVEQRLRFWMRF